MKRVISILLSIVLVLSSFALFSNRVNASVDPNKIIGEWTGSYYVKEDDGKSHERIITLKIISYKAGAIKGTFKYYSPDYRNGLLGIYYFEGTINESSKTFSFQGKYMVKDDGYYSHDSYSTYSGTIDWDNGIMRGNHGGDYELHHSAINSNNKLKPSDVIHAYVGNHYGTSVGGRYNVQRASTIDITSCSSDGSIEGRFIIYPIVGASNQINCIYKFSGFIDLETGNIGFMGTQWIQYPDVGDGWTFQNYVGKLENGIISGNNGNGPFRHKKGYIDKNGDVYVSVTGRFKDGATGKVISDKEIYMDNYFLRGNSGSINGGLAKLSMLASASVYNKGYSKKIIEKCGFEHKYFKAKSTWKKNNKVSFEVGYKKVNNAYIVAVWVKGTSGFPDAEWKSNVNVGFGKLHDGFTKAEKYMNKKINSYLGKKVKFNKSGNVKIWVTGHSRGAAVANLYAKRMNEKIGKKNVFAYTFATPRIKQGKIKDNKTKYSNIHNFLNRFDVVTLVPIKGFKYRLVQIISPNVAKIILSNQSKYRRYGIDKNINLNKKMKSLFKKKTGKKYKRLSISHTHTQMAYLAWLKKKYK